MQFNFQQLCLPIIELIKYDANDCQMIACQYADMGVMVKCETDQMELYFIDFNEMKSQLTINFRLW